ncbi:hypothetical protein [Streptomyces sp. NBC_01497]|uniref:hypothetical protein n=1 Tax=Streptomyces sp. NBC_01497 TaxID=2903885 RepID=UPI002E30A6E0|nr:hypothetical protein [Streptomyces sp. NBC_01497]
MPAFAEHGGDTYVYPASAAPYLASGRLNPGLFDVTELIADGYDDAHAAGLPLIFSYGPIRLLDLKRATERT